MGDGNQNRFLMCCLLLGTHASLIGAAAGELGDGQLGAGGFLIKKIPK